MKKTKRLLSFILSLLMLFCTTVFNTNAIYASGTSISSSTSISIGTTYSDKIEIDSKRIYQFTNLTTCKNTIKVTFYMPWIYIALYDKNGNEIWSINPYWNSDISQCYISEDVFLNAGTYYLAFIYDGSVGNFKFSVDANSANESFGEDYDGSNNSLYEANLISFNKVYKGQLGLIDDKDFYKLELSNSGTINLNFNAFSPWIFLNLYDVDGVEIWSRELFWNDDTKKTTLNETIYLTSGTYYFGVIKYEDLQTQYNFNLTFSSSNESFVEKNGGCNNLFSNASQISTNKAYKGQLALNDHIDIYKVFIDSGMYSISVNTNGICADICIYDRNEMEVYSKNLYCNSNTQKITFNEFFNISAGTYYFVVSKSEGIGDCNYNFSINRIVQVSAPNTLKITERKTNSIKVKWSKISGVNGYQLQRKVGDTYKTIANTTSTSYTVTDLASATNYSFRVRAYKTVDGKKYYSSWKTLTTPTKPAKVSIKTPTTNSKHQIIAKWNKVARASGYQVQYCKNKSCSSVIATKTVSGQSKVSYTGKNFTKNKTYYIRVRAYKTVNNTKYYGAWSSVKTIKCK